MAPEKRKFRKSAEPTGRRQGYLQQELEDLKAIQTLYLNREPNNKEPEGYEQRHATSNCNNTIARVEFYKRSQEIMDEGERLPLFFSLAQLGHSGFEQ
ncbi:hypothetical protein ACOSP7_001703 [Xanthoceras sorbifolium]